jgi:hypothetical protein
MLYQLKDMKLREVFPGFSGRFIHTELTTQAYWEIASGSTLPVHHHIHEQIVHVLEGEFELVLDGVPYRLNAVPLKVWQEQFRASGGKVRHRVRVQILLQEHVQSVHGCDGVQEVCFRWQFPNRPGW